MLFPWFYVCRIHDVLHVPYNIIIGLFIDYERDKPLPQWSGSSVAECINIFPVEEISRGLDSMFLEGFERVVNAKAPEFPDGFTWLNTKGPLSLSKLKGHIVLLDFWTYCCGNCMHMVPVLEQLGEKYRGKPVVIIGVHSAKFENEKKPENVLEAVKRYEITHPVVVDREMRIWHNYGVNAWPTFVFVDPSGKIAAKRSGERDLAEFDTIIESMLDRAEKDGTLTRRPIKIVKFQPTDKRTLSYPGKLSFSPDEKSFALSDSDHNRILIIDAKSAKIKQKIGGEKGLKDGSLTTAKFFRPQGVLWLDENTIYVADTENHALRVIDLSIKKVKTLAGDGEKSDWRRYTYALKEGKNSELNSPWDLAYYNGAIIIAMAGLHQLWAYDIKSGLVYPFAGTGRENLFDGDYQSAEFAQPSGLWVHNGRLYVTDSEVSAVRSIDLGKKFVSTLVGQGLFAFGHKDGKLAEARLQHPLGLCAEGNKVYVADTYNSSIRLIDLKKDEVTTLVGKPGEKSFCRFGDSDCDTLGLYEPSDVKMNSGLLYIVDTNNHLVRTFDTERMVLGTFTIKE